MIYSLFQTTLLYLPLLLSTISSQTIAASQPFPAKAANHNVNPRQPTPNPLDWLDLNASSVYASQNRVPLSEPCGVGMAAGNLGFPHAGFTNALAGNVECSRRLVFKDFPVGYGFTVLAVQVDGFARVEKGAWLDRVEVGVEYFGFGPEVSSS
jgi:hypothetical protein